MNPTFPTLLGIVAPVFVVIAAGLALRRVEWLTAEADETLLRMTVNFLFPCFIADTILGNRTLGRAENLLVPPVIGFAGVIVGFGLAALAAKLLKLPPPSSRAFTFTTGLQNYGRWLPLSRELRQILVVQAAMPAAMMPIILTRHYRADSTISVGIVLTTTAVSLVTIPAWLRFGTWWLGL